MQGMIDLGRNTKTGIPVPESSEPYYPEIRLEGDAADALKESKPGETLEATVKLKVCSISEDGISVKVIGIEPGEVVEDEAEPAEEDEEDMVSKVKGRGQRSGVAILMAVKGKK